MEKIKANVTRNDVARAAGVSTATVSYVINNGPRPVATETREKVLKIVGELGYQPNGIARSLRLQKTFTLGLILPDTYNPYFAEVVHGVEQVAFERGFTVVLCHSEYSTEREIQYVNLLFSKRVAGVLWFPATNNAEPANLLSNYGIPFVVLDRVVSGLRAPSVVADNFRGGYLAAEHLIKLGHRRIGCIARPQELYHSQERVHGYRSALQEYGITNDESLIVKGGFRLEDGQRAAFQLLDLNPAPTAIFAYNDFMAIGALRACSERGRRVPQDISIIGFDDIPESAFTIPALTTIRQPKLAMGCRGAEVLISLIERQVTTSRPTQPLAVQLIIRESTSVLSEST